MHGCPDRHGQHVFEASSNSWVRSGAGNHLSKNCTSGKHLRKPDPANAPKGGNPKAANSEPKETPVNVASRLSPAEKFQGATQRLHNAMRRVNSLNHDAPVHLVVPGATRGATPKRRQPPRASAPLPGPPNPSATPKHKPPRKPAVWPSVTSRAQAKESRSSSRRKPLRLYRITPQCGFTPRLCVVK